MFLPSEGDPATVTVTADDILRTNETGTTATFSVVLHSEPTSLLTINVSNNDASEVAVSASALVFGASNWNVAQTVNVTGVDDDVKDGNIHFNITLKNVRSSDTNFHGVDVADVNVTNLDGTS